jgi:glyoxylase-like metal-dependent hydrolase (beta-lactamase superfamily II)
MLWCEAERILIAADALWEHGFGVIFPALPPHDDHTAFDAQAGTLDTIEALAPRLVIPGHGAPFTDVAGALGRARGRLAHFAADPARNTRNGAKVTLAFLLMIDGRLPLDTLAARLAGLKLPAAANRKVYGLDPQAFADTLVADLVKSGAARCADGWLCAAGT